MRTSRVDSSFFEFYTAIREADVSGYPELGAIVLTRGDSRIYAQVDDIERIRTPVGVEFRLQFRVNDAPLTRRSKEQTGRIAVPISTDGQMRYEPPTLYYTLS